MGFGTVARLVVALVLGGAVTGSFVITRYITELEEGIKENVVAAQAPLEAQKAIRDRNAVLTDMVVVTNRISDGLDGVLLRSGAIKEQVKILGESNRATLALNKQMEANNAASSQDLARVVAGLKAMNSSAAVIGEYLRELRTTAAGDVAYLEAIAASTARMNVKTPDLGR